MTTSLSTNKTDEQSRYYYWVVESASPNQEANTGTSRSLSKARADADDAIANLPGTDDGWTCEIYVHDEWGINPDAKPVFIAVYCPKGIALH